MALLTADRQWIEARARAAGFDLAGVASVPEPGSATSDETAQRFAGWVAAGHAGEMDYLQRADDAGHLVRGDLRRAMPWARSVIVCAMNYNATAPLSIAPAPPGTGWIARYAWSGKKDRRGADYHDVLLPKLRTVDAELHARFDGCTTRCYVDTGPLLERGYAARAGVGWIGKNTCVLNQQQGSWLLLGVIVTSLELAVEAWSVPAADRCGSCTRCIDACPTDALLGSADPHAARQMDASRCIAYLTIEKKGSIPEELRAPMGRHVFGCDICQDVCPWNRKAPVAASDALQPRPELVNPALAWLASLDSAAFTRVFRGSPVERTRRQTSRRKLFRRNVAIAMGNSGQREFLPQLQAWAAGEEPMLAEAAAWAIDRLR
jgi:epoxyqueuosine reductase